MTNKNKFLIEISSLIKNKYNKEPEDYFSPDALDFWNNLQDKKYTCGIYKITNLINNKVYIGQSKQIEIRWQQHKTSNKNYALYSAFKKYGIDNFKFEIIEECFENLLNEREKYWINFYHSLAPNGYNMTLGGDSCGHETLEKKVQQYDLNGNFIQEFKSISEASRQTGLDDANISACCNQKLHFHTVGGFQWKFSDNNKIITKYIDKQLKPVIQYDINGNYIAEYPSVSAAAKAVNKASTNISSACKKHGTSAGYKWEYKIIQGEKND